MILKVKVESHPQFKRVDFDIHSIISIPVTKAIFGGALEIETINGPKQIMISPGTQHDH